MTSRKITRADYATARTKIAKAIGADVEQIIFSWDDPLPLRGIELREYGSTSSRGLYAPEVVALAAAGIHPGPEGWEMDEAPVPGPRALPAGVAWYQHGINEHRLEAGRRVLATVWEFEHSALWAIGERSFEASDGRTMEPTLDEAKAAAETACRSNGLFASFGDAVDEQALPSGWAWRRLLEGSEVLCYGRGDSVGRVNSDGSFWLHERRDGMISRRIAQGLAASIGEAKRAVVRACRERGIFAALPEFTTTTPQGQPTGDAARTLRRLLSLAAGEDEHGPIAAPAGETPEERAAMRGRLVDAFIAELGRAVNEDVWHIEDLETALESAREEAATSDANAVELASKLDAAQKRIAEMGGEIDALQVALEASRGARVEADLLHVGAIRRAEKAEGELDAIRAKLAEIIDAAIARKGAAS